MYQNDSLGGQNKGDLMRFVFIFFILTVFSYGQPEGRYEVKNSKELSFFFPKSDSDYMDYLIEKDSADSHINLAKIYLKKGNLDRGEYYLDKYIHEENDPKKLLDYYNLKKDYGNIEKVLDIIIASSDDVRALQYRKNIYKEIQNKELPMSGEKYRVDKIEEFFSYLDRDDELRKFFNSNQWSRDDIKKIIDRLKRCHLKEGSASKKLFDLFATKRERLENRYFSIEGIGDERGYFDYFDFARSENLFPEIKNEFEKLIYLKYKKSMAEYSEMAEGIKSKALDEGDARSLYTLWKVADDGEILEYLKTQGEDYHKTYLEELWKDGEYSLFYSEGMKFLDLYPKSFHRDSIFDRLFSRCSDSQRDEILKRYRGGDSVILNRERIKVSQGQAKLDLMKGEVLRGDRSCIDAFLKEMEKLYPPEELEEKLFLIDRSAYIQYLFQKGMDIPEKYSAAAANYLYTSGKLEELFAYVEYLDRKELKYLSEKDVRYKAEYARRYPFEDENIDGSQEKYLYFSDEPQLDSLKVREMEGKNFMELQEKYYAALYYNKTGEYLKSYRLTRDLSRRYSLAGKITELHNQNIYEIKKTEIKKEGE